MGSFQESTENKGVVCRFVSTFLVEKSFQRFGHPLLPDLDRETPLQMDISLPYVNVFYKRVTSVLTASPMSGWNFLKKNQLEEIPVVQWVKDPSIVTAAAWVTAMVQV